MLILIILLPWVLFQVISNFELPPQSSNDARVNNISLPGLINLEETNIGTSNSGFSMAVLQVHFLVVNGYRHHIYLLLVKILVLTI